MRHLVDTFVTEDEARACIVGIRYVNDSAISVPQIEEEGERWSVYVEDADITEGE